MYKFYSNQSMDRNPENKLIALYVMLKYKEGKVINYTRILTNGPKCLIKILYRLKGFRRVASILPDSFPNVIPKGQ